MSAAIPFSQFIGQLVGVALFICGGIWCIFFWPRRIRGQIDRGEIDAFEGLAKTRKVPVYGFLLIFLAIADSVTTLNQIGFFGEQSGLAGFTFLLFTVGVLVWWFTQKKKHNL